MNTLDYDCPMTGFKKKCSELRAGCPKWIHMIGKHPQTGNPVDEFDCADRWMPVLITEVTKELQGVIATTDEFRREVAEQNEQVASFGRLAELLNIAGQGQARIPDGDRPPLVIENSDANH